MADLQALLTKLAELESQLEFQGRHGDPFDTEMRRLHEVLCEIGKIQVQVTHAVVEQVWE